MIRNENLQPKYRTIKSCVVISTIALCFLLGWEIGWPLSSQELEFARFGTGLIVFFHVLWLVIRVFKRKSLAIKARKLCMDFFLLMILSSALTIEIFGFSEYTLQVSLVRRFLVLFLIINQSLSLTDFLVFLVHRPSTEHRKFLPPGLMFVFTLVGIIIIGTIALMSPNATYNGIALIDALFVASSAVCVTGLCPVDFPATFTFTGQVVILFLIQIGAWGIMSFAYFVALLFGEKISLRDRVVLSDLLSSEKLSQTNSILFKIIRMSLILEAIGAVGLYFSWRNTPNLNVDIWWCSIFHSVSSFCQAGFSLFSDNYASAQVRNNYSVQIISMFLIVIGGIGLAIYQEGYQYLLNRWKRIKNKNIQKHRLTTYFKIVIRMTLVLLVGGALVLFLLDLATPSGGNDGPWYERMWVALFNSVSARSAGFNIREMGNIPNSYAIMICSLMFIGGSPGGTAGGIRTTTLAVAYGEMMRMIRGKKEVEFFKNRAISRRVVERALMTIVLSGALVVLTSIILNVLEPEKEMLKLLFETVSSCGTVGFSLGITDSLGGASKVLLSLTMVIGRVGLLAFVMSLAGQPKVSPISYPRTHIPLH